MSDYDLYWIDEPDGEHVPPANARPRDDGLIFYQDDVPLAPMDDPSWGARALALCAPLRRFDSVDFANDSAAKILEAALRTYLDLAADETLLAIVDRSWGGKPAIGCALTTRRIYFAGPFVPGARADDFGRKGAGPLPPFLRSIAYDNLAPVDRDGALRERDAPNCVPATSWLDDGGKNGHVRDAVGATLNDLAAAAQAEPGSPEIGTAWPDTRTLRWLAASDRRSDEIRAMQGGTRRFGDVLKASAPRIMAVPLVAVLNIAVFVVMIASGVSPIVPDAKLAYAWGASNGPGVLIDGEVWRLFTATCLHYGFLHLFFNMGFLFLFGPKVERLFGFWPFLVLYLLSGLAGSMASVWWHPMLTGAGASGALYGLVGALFGYAVARRDVPSRAILSLFNKGLLIYLAIDSLLGLLVPMVDGAAHIGGFVGGLICGLILNRPWPPRSSGVGFKRPIGAVLLSAGLVATFLSIRGELKARIEADPVMVDLRRQENGERDYNAFVSALAPHSKAFTESTTAFDVLVNRFNDPNERNDEIASDLGKLHIRVQANANRLAAIDVPNAELRLAKDDFLAAHNHLIKASQLLEEYARDADIHFDSSGYERHVKLIETKTNSSMARLKTFAETNGLKLLSDDEP